jgi:hypothetical protein
MKSAPRGPKAPPPIHGQNRALVDLVGKSDGGLHRLRIGDDQRGVAVAVAAEGLGLGDGPRGCGEVLDVGAGRGLRSQQHRREWGDLVAEFGIEARNFATGFVGVGKDIGRQVDVEVGDRRGYRGVILAGLALRRAQIRQPVASLRGRRPGQLLVADGSAVK